MCLGQQQWDTEMAVQEIPASPPGKRHCFPFHNLLNVKDSPVPGENSDHVSLHPALLLGQQRVAEVV